VKADRARLAQTQLRMSFADVVAPISGRTGAALVKAGNVVQENNTTLVTLLQIAPIRVTFGIPEQSLQEVQRLSATGPLEVEADIGNGAVAKGRLEFVDNLVDAATGTIRLKANFANTKGELWPGQFVHVRLRLQMENHKIVVPESAVREGLDGKYVWKVESNAAAMAPVKVERNYRQQTSDETASLAVLVGEGIKPGDLVVTEGQLRLTPGARVTTNSTTR
jgi:membrane fusion protein, multidrug efflux system